MMGKDASGWVEGGSGGRACRGEQLAGRSGGGGGGTEGRPAGGSVGIRLEGSVNNIFTPEIELWKSWLGGFM